MLIILISKIYNLSVSSLKIGLPHFICQLEIIVILLSFSEEILIICGVKS